MSRILLTHSPEALRNYYGARALAGLRALGEVKLHDGAEPLQGKALVAAAADCDLVVSYRQSPGEAFVFSSLPRLIAFLRCAIDIRNIDVAAASRAGVLVTRASPGFVPAVAGDVTLQTPTDPFAPVIPSSAINTSRESIAGCRTEAAAGPVDSSADGTGGAARCDSKSGISWVGTSRSLPHSLHSMRT